MEYNVIAEHLQYDKITQLLYKLGADEVIETSEYLQTNTICHNTHGGTLKLYIYKKSGIFNCYTQCGAMSFFGFLKEYYETRDIDYNWHTDVVDLIMSMTDLSVNEIEGFNSNIDKYMSIMDKYTMDSGKRELKEYNENVLTALKSYPHPLWLKEGITKEVMEQFGIKFSVYQNEIVIPHRDINGRLIGIRIRAIEEEDVSLGKYRPYQLGDTLYKHQLGFNLYGLYEHKEAIKKYHRAVIFESEKSVLLSSVYEGKNSVAVACCGSHINKFQINLLTKELGVNEIIIAFDKEYNNPYKEDGIKYKHKLIDIGKKYQNYATFSYIYDIDNVLNLKDSPIDKGYDNYIKLYRKRFKIL